MKRLDIGSLALFAVSLWLHGAPAVAAPESQLERIAAQALAARQKMMQVDAAPADVDAFLAFFTDDLVYEDPVVKMKIEGKDTIRKGMTGFLGATRNARIVVTGRLSAANVVRTGYDIEGIRAAVKRQLAHGRFAPSHIYFKPNTSQAMVDVLTSIDLYTQKRFHEGS